jgi:hypothetical protein
MKDLTDCIIVFILVFAFYGVFLMPAAYDFATTSKETVEETQQLRECPILSIRPIKLDIKHEYDVYCANSTYEYTIYYHASKDVLCVPPLSCPTYKTNVSGSSDTPPPLITPDQPNVFRQPYIGKPCYALHKIGDTLPCYVQNNQILLSKPITPTQALYLAVLIPTSIIAFICIFCTFVHGRK